MISKLGVRKLSSCIASLTTVGVILFLFVMPDKSSAQDQDDVSTGLSSPSQLDFDEFTKEVEQLRPPAESNTAKASPEATVLSLVQELRQAGNPVPILEYIDWDTAYEKFRERGIAARERIKITSPDSLRSFYSDWFHRSPNIMLRKIGPRLGAMNTTEQRRVMDFFKDLDEKTKHRQAPPDPVLSESLYEIKNTERLEGRATVSLIVTHDQKSRTENVRLVEKNGLWFLDSVYLVKDPFGGEYR